jgi:hypothetical protein
MASRMSIVFMNPPSRASRTDGLFIDPI